MKKNFSNAWKSSSSIRKKRKYQAKAPLHIKHRMMCSTLSEELRKKHGMRSIPVRKGDEVIIMKGKFRKSVGKIKQVDLKKLRVSIEKMQNQKKDGTKVEVYFHPSKLMIKTLNMDDKKRMPQKVIGGNENVPKKK